MCCTFVYVYSSHIDSVGIPVLNIHTVHMHISSECIQGWPVHLVKHQIVQQVVHYLEELESSQEVIDVAPQRLQRRIGLLLPHARDLTCQHAVSHLLQLRGHHNKTLHQHNMESSTHR